MNAYVFRIYESYAGGGLVVVAQSPEHAHLVVQLAFEASKPTSYDGEGEDYLDEKHYPLVFTESEVPVKRDWPNREEKADHWKLEDIVECAETEVPRVALCDVNCA